MTKRIAPMRHQYKIPPDDKRCQAVTRGNSGWDYQWSEPHRCPRLAYEEVGGEKLCRQHAKMRARRVDNKA